jgi:hypothetical protein
VGAILDPGKQRTAFMLALSPICVDKFQRSADASVNLVEFKKASSQQGGSFIEKVSARRCPAVSQHGIVAQGCATMLGSLPVVMYLSFTQRPLRGSASQG